MRSFNYALLFVLIQQNTVTFFSYSIRNYNAMTSEIWTKDNVTKMLGEILKGFFVTVSKTGGGGGGGIKISWVENFLKINKWGGRLLETWEYLQSTLVNTMNLLVNPYFFYIKHLAVFLADFVFSRQSSKAMLSRKFLYSVNQKSEMSDVSHLTLWFCQNSMPLANQTWGQNIFYFFRIFVCFSL